jgi:stage IV sporulation protein FB
MKILNNRARSIRVNPFGIGIIKQESQFFSYQKDIIVYLAGPLFNLMASVIFYLLFSSILWSSQTVACLVGINLVLFLFNLIPVFTLDGGRIVFSILLIATSYHRAYAIMKAVSWCCVAFLLLLGVFVL